MILNSNKISPIPDDTRDRMCAAAHSFPLLLLIQSPIYGLTFSSPAIHYQGSPENVNYQYITTNVDQEWKSKQRKIEKLFRKSNSDHQIKTQINYNLKPNLNAGVVSNLN